jgi:hypothetical protein
MASKIVNAIMIDCTHPKPCHIAKHIKGKTHSACAGRLKPKRKSISSTIGAQTIANNQGSFFGSSNESAPISLTMLTTIGPKINKFITHNANAQANKRPTEKVGNQSCNQPDVFDCR